MTKYHKIFQDLLREEMAPSSAQRPSTPAGTTNPRYAPPQNDIAPFLDDDTNPEVFLRKGIKDTFDAVQRHFNENMNKFAETLSPERIKTSSLGELRDRVSEVFKFVDKIFIYSKGNIEQLSQDPSAIMAAFLGSDPTKMAAFQELHKQLKDFQSAVQEIETQLSSLKGQIDDFVSEVEDIDAEEAAQDIEAAQSAQQQSSAPLNAPAPPPTAPSR